MSDREDPTTLDFLRTLWPEGPLPGSLVVWTVSLRTEGKESFWCDEIQGAVEVALRHRDQREVYFGVALQDREEALAIARRDRPSAELSGVRGGNLSTVAIPGVWADIDVKAPVHAEQDLPPDQDAALSLLETIPHQPTIIVDSGFGLHAYWLFHEPWVFTSDEDRDRAAQLLRGVQAALRAEAEGHGWRLDATADLARVLRVPGTFNHKEPTR